MIHHSIFRPIRAYDRVLLYLNFLFLMAVAFLEFPTSLVGHYSEEQVSVVIHALNAAVASLLLSAISWYAARGHRLVVPGLDDDEEEEEEEEEERVRRLQGLAVPVVFLLSKGVSFLRAPWRRRCTPPGCSCPSQTPSSVGCGHASGVARHHAVAKTVTQSRKPLALVCSFKRCSFLRGFLPSRPIP